MDWSTPLGQTQVISQAEEASVNGIHLSRWRKEHIANGDPLPEGGGLPAPDNPLGDYAMRLAGWATEVTCSMEPNNPMAVGGWRINSRLHSDVTPRMWPPLFPLVPVGHEGPG